MLIGRELVFAGVVFILNSCSSRMDIERHTELIVVQAYGYVFEFIRENDRYPSKIELEKIIHKVDMDLLKRGKLDFFVDLESNENEWPVVLLYRDFKLDRILFVYGAGGKPKIGWTSG